MKQMRVIAWAAAGAALLALSTGAMAQAVSGGDAYQQGYAAGAAERNSNSFNTYNQAYQAGEQAAQNQTAAQQVYNNGYQAGLAQSSQNNQQAYNNGYQNRARRIRPKSPAPSTMAMTPARRIRRTRTRTIRNRRAGILGLGFVGRAHVPSHAPRDPPGQVPKSLALERFENHQPGVGTAPGPFVPTPKPASLSEIKAAKENAAKLHLWIRR